MSITTEIRRTVDEARDALADPKPLHAVAGAGDLVLERLRTAAIAQQKAIQSVRFEPSAVPALVSSTLDNVRGAVTGFPERAQDAVVGGVVRANHTYDDLAKRGANLVRRITRQRASQDLANQVDNTVRAAKATVTTARTATESTRSRAKATATSARNAAAAVTTATSAAASKAGTTSRTRTASTRTRPAATSAPAKRGVAKSAKAAKSAPAKTARATKATKVTPAKTATARSAAKKAAKPAAKTAAKTVRTARAKA